MTSDPGSASLRRVVMLSGAERAVVEIAKLHDYALAPQHEEGKHKARGFAAALGLEREDAAWLRIVSLKPRQRTTPSLAA